MNETGALRGRTALVTGASGGIGEAIVRALRADGAEVVALARREDRLRALADECGCRYAVVDVRDRAALEAVVTELRPDILVNNAGTGHGIAGLGVTDTDDIAVAVETNVAAPLHAIRAALPGMRERGAGHIVNIGSIAGLHVLISAVYGATKAAVHLMTQNLRVELAGSGIRVTEIAPGRVTSEFYASANLAADTAARMGTTAIAELAPADIADAVRYAIAAPAHVNISLIELLPTEQAVGGVNMVPRAPVADPAATSGASS